MLSYICRDHQVLARNRGLLSVPRTTSYFLRRLSANAQHESTKPEPPILWSTDFSKPDDDFWREVPVWKDVSKDDFMSWSWTTKNIIETPKKKRQKLFEFLYAVLPPEIPNSNGIGGSQSRDMFIMDVARGITGSTMSVRATPYILSRINWKDPANDPIFRQFIPRRSIMLPDHPRLNLDSLDEVKDSRAEGAVVHRYPDKALLLPISICPTNCTYCTRSWGIGTDTELVTKVSFKLTRPRLEAAFEYIESQEGLHDIVVSGGDAYYLEWNVIEWIGDRLIGMKNIERFRFASKGLAVAPHRLLDKNDPWTESLIRVSDKARRAGKHMALHTHFNHPDEISWITELASRKLLESGVTVRNQTVLLRGVNDNVDTMLTLINKLAKMAVQPYYIYQCDMVPKIEHLRTPLSTLLDIESQIQGTTAGFYLPKCVVDLPGGGGKRLVSLYESYDRQTGVSTFTQPAIKGRGRDNRVYEYHDPMVLNDSA
ncbi:kama family protein [Hypoxylon cercidicola]|nr:kama family protein [Hypoxylon cercidicola]